MKATAVLAGACALVLGSIGLRPARADADPWADLAKDETSVAAFARDRLGALVTKLGDGGSTSGSVVVFAKDEREREALAARLSAGFEKARTTLASAGLAPEGVGTLSVVWVRVTSGASGAAISPSGDALYVRDRGTVGATEVPALKVPVDGPPLTSSVVATADVALAAQDDLVAHRAARAGPGSASNAVARALLVHVPAFAKYPAWVREGLVAYAEAAAFSEVASVPLHLCGASATAVPAWMTAKARPTAAQARWLGKLFEALLSGASDAPTRLESIVAAGDKAAAVYAQAVGRPPNAVVEAAAGKEKVSCDAAGTVPCPLCRLGKIEMSCETCRGLGGVACPSCDGDEVCQAPGCLRGAQTHDDGKDYNCAACGGSGWQAECRTCQDKVRFPCKVCRGSGKVVRTCPLCLGRGRIACVEGGEPVEDGAEPSAPCPWCQDASAVRGCDTCFGCGFTGCRACHGIGRVPCPTCGGAGCSECKKMGSIPCRSGDGTKAKCATCSGAGTVHRDSAHCPLCSGRPGFAPDPATARTRIAARARGVDAALRKQAGQAMTKAIDFLLSTKEQDAFCLRKQRRTPSAALGAPIPASVYSNALVIGSLAAAHVSSDKPVVSSAIAALEKQVHELLESKEAVKSATVQEAAHALRALVGAGHAPDHPLVLGLVKRLVAAQRPGGYWADDLVSAEPGDAFQSLFAVEALWLAQRRGSKVASDVWTRALAAGLKVGVLAKKTKKRGSFVTGTTIASSAALILMAKAGAGGRASVEDYRAIPQVVQAMAWLDRYFDMDREPTLVEGALERGPGDAGYTTWLYAIERLGRLLSIEEFGGRRWYAEGCRRVISLQLKNGEFEELQPGRLNGPVRTTTSTLLFLSKATPPLTGEPSTDDEVAAPEPVDPPAGAK